MRGGLFSIRPKSPGTLSKGVDAPPGPLLSRVTLPGPVGILGLLCYSVYSDRLGALLNGAKFPREKSKMIFPGFFWYRGVPTRTCVEPVCCERELTWRQLSRIQVSPPSREQLVRAARAAFAARVQAAVSAT